METLGWLLRLVFTGSGEVRIGAAGELRAMMRERLAGAGAFMMRPFLSGPRCKHRRAGLNALLRIGG